MSLKIERLKSLKTAHNFYKKISFMKMVCRSQIQCAFKKKHIPINKCNHQGADFPLTVKCGHINYQVTSKSHNIVGVLKKKRGKKVIPFPSSLQTMSCFPLSSITCTKQFHFLQPVKKNIPDLSHIVELRS